MEAKRLLDVLDKQLAQNQFVAGDEYTIADMAVWPWFGNVVLGNVYDAAEFLDAGSYKHVQRWAKEVAARPAVKRGRIVNIEGVGLISVTPSGTNRLSRAGDVVLHAAKCV